MLLRITNNNTTGTASIDGIALNAGQYLLMNFASADGDAPIYIVADNGDHGIRRFHFTGTNASVTVPANVVVELGYLTGSTPETFTPVWSS